jgi:hypothetical protein
MPRHWLAQPGYAPALIGEARLKAGRGDLPGAVALLDRHSRNRPGCMTPGSSRGISCCPGGRCGRHDAYRKALEIKPDYLAGACGDHSAAAGGGQDSMRLASSLRR